MTEESIRLLLVDHFPEIEYDAEDTICGAWCSCETNLDWRDYRSEWAAHVASLIALGHNR